jgi:hypothetical protein
VSPYVRKTPQRTVAVDDELWDDCLAIAKVRRQKLSDVLRSALVTYRLENQALLDEIKRSPDSRATGT